MSKRSSNSRDHHQHRPSRRASAPGRGQGHPPQPFHDGRQQARVDAVDLPQGDRDPNYYADKEESLTDTSEHVAIPIEDTAHDHAQAQAFSYPSDMDHEQQHWEEWRHRQQWQQWQQQSVAYDPASFCCGPRTTPNTHVPVAYNTDAYSFEVSGPALQILDYAPSLSLRMSPTSTAAHPASMSPKNTLAGMGAWDTPATQIPHYPPAPTELWDRENPRLNLGKLPGRSRRSDSTEALRPSSPFRDIGPSKPPNYDRNHYGEGRSRRRK